MKGFDESLRLNFQSLYGCSKGATDQYMLDYARMFGLKTIVFRHSSIFGGRQFSTFDQSWIGWFVKQALDIRDGKLNKTFTISGTGKQVRDVLFASDLISCYFKAVASVNITAGNVYNIGGGIANSLFLLELFGILEDELYIEMVYDRLPVRQSNQKVFVADIGKAKKHFDWHPEVDKIQGIKMMIFWINS